MHGIHEICCGLPRASECPNGQRSGLNVKDFEDFAAHDGLQLIKVDTLTSAVDALHAVSAGGEPPHC